MVLARAAGLTHAAPCAIASNDKCVGSHHRLPADNAWPAKEAASPSRLPALPGHLPRQDPTSFPARVSRGSGSRAPANSSGKLKVPSVEAAGAAGQPGAELPPQGEHICIHPASARQAAAAQGEGGSRTPPLGTWRNQPLHGSVGMKSLLLFAFLFHVHLPF